MSLRLESWAGWGSMVQGAVSTDTLQIIMLKMPIYKFHKKIMLSISHKAKTALQNQLHKSTELFEALWSENKLEMLLCHLASTWECNNLEVGLIRALCHFPQHS